MKPKNFPARKLARKARIDGKIFSDAEYEAARAIRTKKRRG
jgi:hypothetical protein